MNKENQKQTKKKKTVLVPDQELTGERDKEREIFTCFGYLDLVVLSYFRSYLTYGRESKECESKQWWGIKRKCKIIASKETM